MHSYVFADDRDRLSIDLLSIKTSYAPKRPIDTCLFTKETRTVNMEKLYAAATLQVPNMKETYNMPICTPVLGHSRHRIKKHIDEEIETRLVRAQNGNNPKILNKLMQLANVIHLNIF